MKKSLVIPILGIILFVGLGACAHQPGPPASNSEINNQATAQTQVLPGEAFLRTELFFGMSIAAAPGHPAGMVTEAQWQDFVATRITPQFPNGLTIIDGYGQWLGQDGAVTKEHSKILVLLHPAFPQDERTRADRAIEDIRSAYCRLFHQESVLRVTSPASVAF